MPKQKISNKNRITPLNLIFIFGIFIILFLALAQISKNNKEQSIKNNAQIKTSIVKRTNEIDINKAKPGDIINGFKIIKIEPKNPEQIKEIPLGENVKIDFEGEATLTGKIQYIIPPYDIYCLKVEDNSLPSIHELGDSRFCFSNQDFAKQYFSPEDESKTRTVVIKDFSLIKYPSEGYNTAYLIEVK